MTTNDDPAVAAGHSVDPGRWLGILDELTIAVVSYAAVTGITRYLAGHVERRISLRGAMLLDRLAGILLTAIAVILLANGFAELVVAASTAEPHTPGIAVTHWLQLPRVSCRTRGCPANGSGHGCAASVTVAVADWPFLV